MSAVGDTDGTVDELLSVAERMFAVTLVVRGDL